MKSRDAEGPVEELLRLGQAYGLEQRDTGTGSRRYKWTKPIPSGVHIPQVQVYYNDYMAAEPAIQERMRGKIPAHVVASIRKRLGGS